MGGRHASHEVEIGHVIYAEPECSRRLNGRLRAFAKHIDEISDDSGLQKIYFRYRYF